MWWKWLSGSLIEKYVGGKVDKILEKKRWLSVLFILFSFLLLFFFKEESWKVKGTRIEQVNISFVGMLVWFFYLSCIMG
jgi:hypothetical protein